MHRLEMRIIHGINKMFLRISQKNTLRVILKKKKKKLLKSRLFWYKKFELFM